MQGLHREASRVAGTPGRLSAGLARAQTRQCASVRTKPLPHIQETASDTIAVGCGARRMNTSMLLQPTYVLVTLYYTIGYVIL